MFFAIKFKQTKFLAFISSAFASVCVYVCSAPKCVALAETNKKSLHFTKMYTTTNLFSLSIFFYLNAAASKIYVSQLNKTKLTF